MGGGVVGFDALHSARLHANYTPTTTKYNNHNSNYTQLHTNHTLPLTNYTQKTTTQPTHKLQHNYTP